MFYITETSNRHQTLKLTNTLFSITSTTNHFTSTWKLATTYMLELGKFSPVESDFGSIFDDFSAKFNGNQSDFTSQTQPIPPNS
jgi:hypothetical protein